MLFDFLVKIWYTILVRNGGGDLFRFKGLKCLVCKADFAQSDDIVVCPECGLPYHRACFLENGDCAHEPFYGEEEIRDGFDDRLEGIFK